MAGERIDYDGPGLVEAEAGAAPYELARRWLDHARAAAAGMPGLAEPMTLHVATVDASGSPNVRAVLMRFFDERGPGFVSSAHSAKAQEAAATGGMAGVLTWPALFRAIRFRGTAVPVERDILEGYWVSRPWGSRISALASQQSQPVANRAVLEGRVASLSASYPDTGNADDVPLPEDWWGVRIHCDEVEFWAGRPNRLHDRIVFTRTREGDLADQSAWTRWRRQP